MKQTSLFVEETAEESTIPLVDISLEDKVQMTLDSIKNVLRAGHSLSVATSYGKDSSVMTNIALQAIKEVVDEDGHAPECIISTSNTLVENPVMDAYSRSESKKIEEFVAAHKLPVRVDIVSPSLSNNYMVNIIGGRTVATLPGMGAKCSDMMKVAPITRHKKKIFKELGGDQVVTLVGKRFDESEQRRRNMEERNENAHTPVMNERGEWLLSPIADFTLDDIFTYIGLVRSEIIPCYSNFDDLVQIYRDANAGSCMVSVYDTGKSSSTGCGASTGCWTCLRVASDKSMENMLQEEQFAYMQPLNNFREYLGACHFDPKRRNWLSRTVSEEGTVKIAPNAYSPQFCKELLKYALTIDAEEREAAWVEGIPPRFQILREEDVLAIDVLWNRYGYTTGLTAAKVWHEVNVEGMRWYPPENEPVHDRSQMPDMQAEVAFVDDQYDHIFSGFRDIESCVADIEYTVEKGGLLYSGGNVGDEFAVDSEGADLFFGFEVEYALEKYHKNTITPTAAFHYLYRLGPVQLFKGSHSEIDRMLRMANQIHRHGIRDILNDPEQLLKTLENNMSAERKVTRQQPGLSL